MTVLKAMARPAKVIYSSSLLQILSIWGALVFAMFYVFSTSLPDMLQDLYDFSPALTGVSFLTFSTCLVWWAVGTRAKNQQALGRYVALQSAISSPIGCTSSLKRSTAGALTPKADCRCPS